MIFVNVVKIIVSCTFLIFLDNFLISKSMANETISSAARWGLFAAILILFLIALVVIFFLLYREPLNLPRNTKDPLTQPIAASLNGFGIPGFNNGSSFPTKEVCLRSNNLWDEVTETCVCRRGYYGPTCNLLLHNPAFVDAGTIIPGGYTINTIQQINNVPLSFYQLGVSGVTGSTTCMNLCLGMTDCSMVYYDNNNCLLIKDMILGKAQQIPYNQDTPVNLFIRQDRIYGNTAIIYSDRVVLYSSPPLPKRPWVSDPLPNQITIYRGMTESALLPFRPTGEVNTGTPGYYYNAPFTSRTIPLQAVRDVNLIPKTWLQIYTLFS